MLDIPRARACARARAHPGIHKRTLCGCSYWESSRGELLAIQQSVKIFALSMLDISPARAPARARARTPESIRERSVDAATGNPVGVSCWQSSRV
jgi:hypothetical protein